MGLAVRGAGAVVWRGAGTTQVSQTGRWEWFQSDGVNELGLDEGAGIDSDRTAVTHQGARRCGGHVCVQLLAIWLA